MTPPPPDDLRALTVQQPWASAIALGLKPVENRPLRPLFSGAPRVVAIHAGLTWHEQADACYELAELDGGKLPPRKDLPFGAIVAFALMGEGYILADREARPHGLTSCAWAFGPRCYPIRAVARLPAPVPCRGALGLWRPGLEVEARLRELAAGARWEPLWWTDRAPA